MEWLKIREDLPEDPVVIAVAASTRLSPDDVVGKLVRLWRWARRQTADGHIVGVSPAYVDKLVGRKGFAKAMQDAPEGPWLIIEPNGLTFPDWDTHNSKAAKERAMNTLRKQVARAEGRAPDGSGPVFVPPLSRFCPGATETREREDEKSNCSSLRSEPASPPAPRPRRAPSGPVQEFLTWFSEAYAVTVGSPYPITTKDAVTAMRLLKSFDGDELRRRATRLLESKDPWLARTDRGIGVLSSQINRPEIRGAEVETPARDVRVGSAQPSEFKQTRRVDL